MFSRIVAMAWKLPRHIIQRAAMSLLRLAPFKRPLHYAALAGHAPIEMR